LDVIDYMSALAWFIGLLAGQIGSLKPHQMTTIFLVVD